MSKLIEGFHFSFTKLSSPAFPIYVLVSLQESMDQGFFILCESLYNSRKRFKLGNFWSLLQELTWTA